MPRPTALEKGCGKSSRKVDAWRAYRRLENTTLSSPSKDNGESQVDMFENSCNTSTPPRERHRP